MRDITTKADGSSTLNGSEFNSSQLELENAVTQSGQSLDGAAGPDTDSQQLARAGIITGQGATAYSDGGAANAFVLTARQATFVQPASYTDGMTVSFKAAATNTGACTINVSGLGSLDFRKAGGASHAAGEIVANNFIVAQYIAAQNRFEEVSNTTPDASGPAAPDQIAVYEDTGDASSIQLTIEPGYTQPSAFTDQMVILFKVNVTNNGVSNHGINISGLGSRDVVEQDGTDPIAGRLSAGSWVQCVFREVRNEWEIAFVYDLPTQAGAVPALVTSSSGVLYNVSSVPEVRAPVAHTDGMVIIFRAPQTNTGSVSVNLNGIGAISLRTLSGSNFVSGEIRANDLIIATYLLGEDRLRAFIGQEFRDLREERSARLTNAQQALVNADGSEVRILFPNAPSDDGLGFYDAARDSFVVPAGVSEINAQANIQGGITGTGAIGVIAFITEIKINGGTTIGSQTVVKTNGSEGMSVCVIGLPVSPGDQIDMFLTGSAGAAGASGNDYVLSADSSFSIQASRFDD